MQVCLIRPDDEKEVSMEMSEQQTPERKRANIRLALFLGAVALLLALWPLYLLNNASIGG